METTGPLRNLFCRFLLIFLVAIAYTPAQYNIGSYIGIYSDILEEQRVLVVGLPEGYDQTTVNYPVLYLLDGDYHFHHVTGLVDFLADLDLIPRMIVIGIINTNRDRDFTPTSVTDLPASGGANNFLAFLEDELFPAIDHQFRTVPHRIIFGHSLGGLFGLYSLVAKPEFFNAHIIISPHVPYNDQFIISEAQGSMDTVGYEHKVLYMALGDEEIENFYPTKRLNRIIKKKKYKDFRIKFEVLSNTDHGSVVHKALYNGLEFAYSGRKFPSEKINKGLPAINKHYKILSKRLGYTINPPETDMNEIGYALLNDQSNEEPLTNYQNILKAIAVFQHNVTLYPNSPNVYDSLGDAYQAVDQDDQALENFQIAVKKGEELSDPRLQVYRNHLREQFSKMDR